MSLRKLLDHESARPDIHSNRKDISVCREHNDALRALRKNKYASGTIPDEVAQYDSKSLKHKNTQKNIRLSWSLRIHEACKKDQGLLTLETLIE